jgi:hypothetical protein
MNSRKVTNLELILLRMRMVVAYRSPECLNRWKNFFNQVLNVHGVHDIRQMDIHMAEPLAPESSLVEVEVAVGKLISCKSLGTDQILAKLIKARVETLHSGIHRLICSIWNKELPQQWKESVIVPIYKKGGKTVIIIEESPFYQLPMKCYPHYSGQVNFICQRNYWGSSVWVQGKDKVTMLNQAPCHEGVLALDGGEWSASCPCHFTAGERTPATAWIGGGVGPRASLDMVVERKKFPAPAGN